MRTYRQSVVVLAFLAAALLCAQTAYAQTAGYGVSFVDTTVAAGDSFEVAWQAPAGTRRSDWVGLYRLGAANSAFVAWQYIPNTGTEGILTFAGRTPGEYEARLFTNNAYTRVAVASTNLTVSPAQGSGSYTVSVPAGTVTPDAPIDVSFTAPTPRETTRDWVGIYRTDANDRTFVAWQYLPESVGSGSLTFSISRVGTYEARLFTQNGFTKVATSQNSFTVGGGGAGTSTTSYSLTASPSTLSVGQSVTVSYAAPSSANRSRDWIGMYRTGDDDRSFIDWEYVGASNSGSLTFTPSAAGTYNFRYFKNNGYTKAATSLQVTVAGGGGGQCAVASLDEITNFPPANGPIVAFGDSLTAGVGATNNQDYVSQLERRAGVAIINKGVSGDTTEEALGRLQSDVLARDPSVVIVWLGGNDIIGRFYERVRDGLEDVNTTDWLRLVALRLTGKIPDTAGITEDETFENLTEIIERIQAGGAVTIVIGFSGGIFDEDLESRYEAVAEATGSLYVPDALNNVLGRPSLMSDLVHPNNDGYAIVADRVLPYLQCAIQ